MDWLTSLSTLFTEQVYLVTCLIDSLPHPSGNVMHLVSSGGQHHLISQPAQVAVLSAASTHPANTSSPAPSGTQLPHYASSQGFSSSLSRADSQTDLDKTIPFLATASSSTAHSVCWSVGLSVHKDLSSLWQPQFSP